MTVTEPSAGALDARLLPPATRIAVLSDVHGNRPALEAVLTELRVEISAAHPVDTVIFLGDLTWGPEPRAVLELASSLSVPTYFVRGNAERAIGELAAGTRELKHATERWMLQAHSEQAIQRVTSFHPAVRLTLTGPLGAVWLSHASPRSDIELLTPETPVERIRAATAGIAERTIVHGHTHLQYERRLDGFTIVGPGSVGLPYSVGDQPGARWAILDERISLRTTPYDIDAALRAAERVGFPSTAYARYLRDPLTLQDIVDDAEAREFSD